MKREHEERKKRSGERMVWEGSKRRETKCREGGIHTNRRVQRFKRTSWSR